MSKYQHMSADELANHIELFGTEDERIIMDKLHQEPDYDDCPYCAAREDEADRRVDAIASKVRDAIALLKESL